MTYEIKGKHQSKASVRHIIKALQSELPRHYGRILSVTNSSIEFTSPITQFNWNIFAPVSHGMITVKQQGERSILSYQISLFRVRVMLVIFSIMVILLTLNSGEPAVSLTLAPVGIAIAWGWVYGMNYLTTKARVSTFFARVLREIPEEEY